MLNWLWSECLYSFVVIALKCDAVMAGCNRLIRISPFTSGGGSEHSELDKLARNTVSELRLAVVGLIVVV